MTPDQFMQLAGNKHLELVDGVLVPREKGNLAAWLASELTLAVSHYVSRHRLGWVFGPGAAFQMNSERPNTLRRPSGSYVSFATFGGREPSETYDCVAPDLAIECVGPAGNSDEMADRASEYLVAGVKRVWLIEPKEQSVRVFPSPASGSRFDVDVDELDGGTVVPGFRYRIARLFSFPRPRH